MVATPTDRLLRQTQRRLFAVTLALLVLLVVGVGAVTLAVGTSALDANVDTALRTAVAAEISTLGGELPGGDDDGEHGDAGPAVADTVLVVLGSDGSVLRVRGALPAGMPVREAMGRAAEAGEDWRTIGGDDTHVRLLTVPLVSDDGATGFVQGGFDLNLHEAQTRSLQVAVISVGALGLLAAALITLLVTSRALIPIRRGFEAQRRFVADASHELRTPAALIRANAEVMEREGLVAADGQDLLTDVIAEADRLSGLVNDLLQLAAWDDTRLVLDPALLDIATVAREVVRGATAFAGTRSVTLQVLAGEPAWASADRARLVQLLLILVDNAVDHSPADGTVAVAVRGAGDTGGAVVVEVDDEGPGVPEAERERVFEPFTRLPGTTRHGSGGTGLGLAIARRIVTAHGGSIEAGSTPAGGARFRVTLPGMPAPATPA